MPEKAFCRSCLPPLHESRGLTWTEGDPVIISDPVSGETLAEMSFDPMRPDEARAAVLSGAAQMMVASVTEPDLGSQAVALDALVPIMAPDNPLPRISTTDLARVLSGEVENWAAGGRAGHAAGPARAGG